MKRLIAAGVILVLVLITSTVGIFMINSTAIEVEKRIKQIQSTAFSDSGKRAENFFYFWEQKRELMAVFVNHNEIDEIVEGKKRMLWVYPNFCIVSMLILVFTLAIFMFISIMGEVKLG